MTPMTKIDEEIIKNAMRLFRHTGDGFVMHMNNGMTLCRKCVEKDKVAIFASLGCWSKDDKTAACFPDLFTRETAGSNRCGGCNQPFSVHRPAPPVSDTIVRMTRRRTVYTCAVRNGTHSFSTLPKP